MAALALGGMLRFGLRPPLRTPPNVNYTTPRDTTAVEATLQGTPNLPRGARLALMASADQARAALRIFAMSLQIRAS